MAEKCVNCGKSNIAFSAPTIKLIARRDEKMCDRCFGDIRKHITEIENADISNFGPVANDLFEFTKMKFTPTGVQYISDYLEQSRYEKTVKNEASKAENFKKVVDMGQVGSHLMTTGFSFDGYKITRYNGIVSGEVVLGTGFLSEISAGISDFFGTASEKFAQKLKLAKESASEKMVLESLSKGGNATIGVAFDYIILGKNMIGVVATGTCVVIECET